MEETYFLSQMVNLLQSSIYICNWKEKTVQEIGSEEGARKLTEDEQRLITERFRPEPKEFPVIKSVGDGLVAALLWSERRPDEWIFAGPIIPGYPDAEHYKQMVKKNKRVERMGYKIQVCPLDTFVSGVLLVHYFMTGHKLTRDDLWKDNGDRSKKVNQMPKRTASDLFYIHENHGQHNPYEQELRELEGIRHGDVEALRQSMEETYAGKIGILAKDPLRNQKNIAIGNITQASRAAIDGGVNVEESFSVTDSFIQQVEELDSVPEVEMFTREAKYTYARMVAKENDGSQSDKGKNPLIAGTKEYIYSHLHSAIRIADIAKHLHVNADYLSHLFRTQEGMTIKRYILNEKILRSQNLLRYSNYGVQEIGFYLGFSSQSHFSHVFQEVTKMSPNAYRKKYGSRKWEK